MPTVTKAQPCCLRPLLCLVCVQAAAQFEAGVSAAAPVVGDRLEEAAEQVTQAGQQMAQDIQVSGAVTGGGSANGWLPCAARFSLGWCVDPFVRFAVFTPGTGCLGHVTLMISLFTAAHIWWPTTIEWQDLHV